MLAAGPDNSIQVLLIEKFSWIAAMQQSHCKASTSPLSSAGGPGLGGSWKYSVYISVAYAEGCVRQMGRVGGSRRVRWLLAGLNCDAGARAAKPGGSAVKATTSARILNIRARACRVSDIRFHRLNDGPRVPAIATGFP